MNFHKINTAAVFIALAILTVILFWKIPALLIFLLVFLAVILQKISPIKKAFIWFLCTSIVGPATEIFMINLGNHPWTYSAPNIFGVPFWLFPLYGLSGLIFVVLYGGIQGSGK